MAMGRVVSQPLFPKRQQLLNSFAVAAEEDWAISATTFTSRYGPGAPKRRNRPLAQMKISRF
jgi:hypothetical protein